MSCPVLTNCCPWSPYRGKQDRPFLSDWTNGQQFGQTLRHDPAYVSKAEHSRFQVGLSTASTSRLLDRIWFHREDDVIGKSQLRCCSPECHQRLWSQTGFLPSFHQCRHSDLGAGKSSPR